MKRDIHVDLRGMKLEGNVIDISTIGNNIIPEIVNINYGEHNEAELEKEYLVWDNKNISSEDNIYDCGCSFFSLCSIRGKRNVDKALKELRRVLKGGGKLFIWDIYIPALTAFGKFNIRTTHADGREKTISVRKRFNPFRIKFADIIQLLENNGYKIMISTISNSYYYIEAANTKEVKDENNSCGS